MTDWLLPFLCGLGAAVISAWGVGGGTLLLLVMTLFLGVDQRTAQGINLLFFLPTAISALLCHWQKGYLDTPTWKAAVPVAVPAALAGAWIATAVDVDLLRRPFGIYLLLSGLIMVLTLWFSKKAHRVVQTSINLSSSTRGDQEQFGSSLPGRLIVRAGLSANKTLHQILPNSLFTALESRMQPVEQVKGAPVLPFDQVRAAINLVVSSILIASATSLKLPLSTTYVTFMVAMGSSFADGAWNRESAVYRISGVLAVISGMANSFLDTSITPSCMEIFKEKGTIANIFTKLSISIAQFLLPFAIGFVAARELPFRTIFLATAVIILVDGAFLAFLPFPPFEKVVKGQGKRERMRFTPAAIVLICLGFTTSTTFMLWMNCNQELGRLYGLADPSKIQSFYSVGIVLALYLNVCQKRERAAKAEPTT